MKQVFLLTCLLSVAISAPVGDDWSDAAGYEECPDWVVANKTLPEPVDDICGVKLECPDRKDVDNPDCGFGIRKVLGGKWVSTNVDLNLGEKKYEKAFMSLFYYISGANADSAKIPMTAPVLTKSYMDSSYKEVAATMHFYIPAAFQANPPTPTDSQVYIEEWDDALIYYRALGEESPVKVWVEEYTNLAAALQKTGKTFYPYMTVGAGFSQPGSKQQRFEAMFVAM